MGFDLNAGQRQQLGYRLIDRINAYYSGLRDQPVQQPVEERNFPSLEKPIPELGADAQTVLDGLCTELMDRGFHVPSANYFGLANPTPTYMAVLAEALVAALNPQLASLARSQMASRIEQETLGWLAERAGWPQGSFGGSFTSGGTEANLTALALAIAQRCPQAADEGLPEEARRWVVYASSEAHHSLEKSLALLGLGRKAVRRIRVTDAAEMDAARLRQQIVADRGEGLIPLAIVGTAGTTSSGAIDPLPELAAIAREAGAWFHVDGAFGAAVLLSNRLRGLVRGLDLADSFTIDPHKWLAMPFASGVVLTRHPALLEPTFGLDTSYLPRANNPLPDYFRVSTQWSRRMNSLKLWLTLQVHGRAAYEAMMDRQMELAQSMETAVLATGMFELAAPRRLTILNFRVKSGSAQPWPEDTLTRLHHDIAQEFSRDGRQWISTTRVDGRSVLRMMVISYLSEQRHVDELTVRLEAAARTTLEQAAIRC